MKGVIARTKETSTLHRVKFPTRPEATRRSFNAKRCDATKFIAKIPKNFPKILRDRDVALRPLDLNLRDRDAGARPTGLQQQQSHKSLFRAKGRNKKPPFIPVSCTFQDIIFPIALGSFLRARFKVIAGAPGRRKPWTGLKSGLQVPCPNP